jgi:hypothetical protein
MKRSRIWPSIKGKRQFMVAMASVVRALVVSAKSPELQQKVAEVKEAMAANKQALAQYTWQEQVTVSLKGEQKKQEHFQVRLGPEGKPQKQWLDGLKLRQLPAAAVSSNVCLKEERRVQGLRRSDQGPDPAVCSAR